MEKEFEVAKRAKNARKRAGKGPFFRNLALCRCWLAWGGAAVHCGRGVRRRRRAGENPLVGRGVPAEPLPNRRAEPGADSPFPARRGRLATPAGFPTFPFGNPLKRKNDGNRWRSMAPNGNRNAWGHKARPNPPARAVPPFAVGLHGGAAKFGGCGETGEWGKMRVSKRGCAPRIVSTPRRTAPTRNPKLTIDFQRIC
jgi:hypothetical protein